MQRVPLVVLVLYMLLATHSPDTAAQEGPGAASPSPTDASRVADWIPAGSVAPAVERRAIESRARLESPDPAQQELALDMIRRDALTGSLMETRIAAVPLVIDLLSEDYSILQAPVDRRIAVGTRIRAIELLGLLGGDAARSQIRNALATDTDPAVRARAAQLLAEEIGGDPDADLQAVGTALRRASARASSEAEVSRLLDTLDTLLDRVWEPMNPTLVEALVEVVSGPYSSRSRNRALGLLESLADR